MAPEIGRGDEKRTPGARVADKAVVVVPASAVPGSLAWSETVVANAKRYATFAEKDVRPLVERYRELCEYSAWKTWLTDEPRTLERFCREALGYELEFLESMSAGVAVLDNQGFSGPISVLQAREALAAQGRARAARAAAIDAADAVPLPARGRPRKGVNNTFTDRTRADGESYLRRRLKRDRPDLYEQVRAGRSAHAAAVEAGFRHKMITVRADDVESAARTLRGVYDHDARERLADLLSQDD